MSNDFYNHATYPAPNSAGSSAAMRAELELIKAGFDKMPTLTGNGYKVIGVNSTGTALISDPKLMNVDFSTTAIAAGAVGRLTWNDTDGTLDLGLKGGNVTLQLGQEQNVRIYNEGATGFVDMQVVRITGSSGTRLTADLARADAEATSASTIAIMTEPAPSHGEGFATTFGLIRQVDTSAFTEGATLYLSPTVAGGITTTRPIAPNNTVILGWCVRSHATQGSIYVNINNGYELDELHDVLITSVANNNMLRYNSSLSVWQNIAGPAGAVVGTTDTQTLTNKTISGGTVTGAVVTGLSAPSASSDAATKGYVDAADALKLNLAGGTMSGAIAMGTNKITGLGDPTAAQDAATKAYVDTAVQGLDAKASVRVATTANITLSGTQTVDGIALSVGDRVLVKDQATAANNGLYLVSASTWTRTTDADTWAELVSAFVFVEQGTTNGNNGYTCTVAAGGTLGSTAVTWVQFSGAGQINAGAGLTKTGNTLDVGTASSARIVVNSDNIDLATTGVTAGNYALVTVDVYGRVTGGSLPTTISGFGITDAYTKTQVDNSLALKLNLSGGTMSGAIAMGGSKITGLGAPTTDNDAVTLKYVSDLYGSTASAAASAAAALVSQNAAASSASAASTSATNAAASASSASTSATSASGSATSASASAASAAASYDSFDDRYLGPKSTAPAVDNDGNALLVGALYFDTTINSMRVYDGSLWMSAGSSVNGTSRRYRYIATAGQTTFTGVDSNGATLAYDPLYLDVYLNGSRLDQSDYTATSGSSIVLGVAASVNDEVNIICFGTFAVATHVLKTGDTMTGLLTLPNLSFSGTGGRIIGDFSNATAANQVIWQTSTTNGNTTFQAMPNGTGVQSNVLLRNSSDLANNAFANIRISATELGILSSAVGTGTYLPMTFYTGGSERIRVDTSGNVGIGTSSPQTKLQAEGTSVGALLNVLTLRNGSAIANSEVGIFFAPTDQTTNIRGAQISAINDGSNNIGLKFYTGSGASITSKMQIDPSGNLGLGVTPSAWYASSRVLQLGSGGFIEGRNADYTTLELGQNAYLDTAGTWRYLATAPASKQDFSNGVFKWNTAPSGTAGAAISFTQAMTLDASGRLGLGVTSPNQAFDMLGNIQMRASGIFNLNNSDNTNQFYLQNTGATGGGNANLIFQKTNYGEVARIDSSGNLLVGATSPASSSKFLIQGASATYNLLVIKDTSTSFPDNNFQLFLNDTGGNAGKIAHTASTTVAYVTSSDYRLKENVQPMTGALEKVSLLKPCTYQWKDGGGAGQGFIAHELQAVIPDAVVGEKDAVNEDGSIDAQGIDTSFLVATLTAAIQEQQAIIESLTARLDAANI